MHLKRWLTGLTILPFLILLIFKGGPFLFTFVVGMISIFAMWEFFQLVFKTDEDTPPDIAQKTHAFRQTPGLFGLELLAFGVGFLMIWAAYIHSFKGMIGLITVNLLLAAPISLKEISRHPLGRGIVLKQVLAVVYIPLLLSYLILIRNSTGGAIWVFFVLIIVFAGDTGAYYIGSSLGKHKLCPSISPGKTIEGSVGGLLSNLVTGALFKWVFFPTLSWGLSLLFFLFIGAASQIGDLFESTLKRFANVKDSGILFPGHGGMLDRIDALIFAAPIAYLFKSYILK